MLRSELLRHLNHGNPMNVVVGINPLNETLLLNLFTYGLWEANGIDEPTLGGLEGVFGGIYC
jgi:hypothetical protein